MEHKMAIYDSKNDERLEMFEEEDCIRIGFLCKYERAFHAFLVLDGLLAGFR